MLSHMFREHMGQTNSHAPCFSADSGTAQRCTAAWRGPVGAQPAGAPAPPRRSVLLSQQNFQRLPQLTHVTNVVIGSSALRVCIW